VRVKRRAFLACPLLLAARGAHALDYPQVLPDVALAFPRDHGSHPAFRIEWWYVTGWVADDAGTEYGVQVTFFRNRPGVAEDNPSAFAPGPRAARAGFGLAEASTATTDVWIGDWSLALARDVYTARIAARTFALDLSFSATQPLLLEGDGGYSRKGPDPRQASYYYSRPHLGAAGTLTIDGRARRVAGSAWLDHEWSSEVMARDAVGWDWTGINLADGGALMAFRMRDARGEPIWAGGTLRDANGSRRTFGPHEIGFAPQRHWRSPRTGIDYPVEMRVSAGGTDYALAPLLDDQELDSRGSTGTLYWEGAVRAQAAGRAAGKGYLELTGYGKALRL
jgi:predicted secreted hydrolase